MFRMLSLLTAGLIYAGCSSQSDQNNSMVNIDPESLDRTDSLVGIDRDGNGVRDDIDGFIKSNFKSTDIPLITTYARSIQNTLLVDTSNPDKLKSIYLLNSMAQRCVDKALSASTGYSQNISDALHLLTINTGLRFISAVKYTDAIRSIEKDFSSLDGLNCLDVAGG